MGYLENVLGPKNNLTPSKLKFFEPWSPELILRSDFCFSHFLKNFIISFFFKNILTMFIWVWLIILWTEKKTFGGCFCSKGPNVKNQFFGKKIFRQIFQKKFFAHRIRNFVLIPKWFYFLSFAQNWPICEWLKFLLLKIEDFPFSGVSAPGPP